MKVKTIIFTGSASTHMLYTYEDGSRKVMSYPPKSTVDRKLVEQFGGLPGISRATYQHSEEIHKERLMFERFRSMKEQALESFNISVIINNTITKTELMKLKMSIFEHEFVRESKNTELLTKIRKSHDPVDLVMYFGILRNDSNNGS